MGDFCVVEGVAGGQTLRVEVSVAPGQPGLCERKGALVAHVLPKKCTHELDFVAFQGVLQKLRLLIQLLQ